MKKYLFILITSMITLMACGSKDQFGLPLIKDFENKNVTDATIAAVTKQVSIGFVNPRLEGSKYVVDVVAKSLDTCEVFGINVRFFYESSQFTNICKFRNFQGGYGLTLTGQPIVATGNASSKIITGFSSPVRYVNGSIQLNDLNQPRMLLTSNWTKLFEVELNPIPPTNVACNPLVWEKMVDPAQGGFLGGSDGLTATVFDIHRVITEKTDETGVNLNWTPANPQIKNKYPLGSVIPCN